MSTPETNNWKALVVDQGVLPLEEMGSPDLEAALMTLTALNVIAAGRSSEGLAKAIEVAHPDMQKFGPRARLVGETALAKAADSTDAARRLYANAYALTEAADTPRSDEEFEADFGRFMHDYGEATPESKKRRQSERARLKLKVAELSVAATTTEKPTVAAVHEVLAEAATMKHGEAAVGYEGFKAQKRRLVLHRFIESGKLARTADSYREVSESMFAAVEPQKLWSSMIGSDVNRARGAVGSYHSSRGGLVSVALLPTERSILVQAPIDYGMKASEGVQLHRPRPHTDADMLAMKRASHQALDPRVHRMTIYKTATLERQQVLLEKFVASPQVPGLERFDTMVDQKIQFAEVEGLIDEVLDVVGAQQEWRADERAEARRAVDMHLYNSPEMTYAEELFTLLLNYNKHRQLLFQEKIAAAKAAMGTDREDRTRSV